MTESLWQTGKTRYTLEGDFQIEKANASELSRFSAIYRKNNNWFRQSFEKLFSIFEDEEHCFWIIQDNQRVGGVIIKPNEMGWLFLIPPFCDRPKVLNLLVKHLMSCSNPDKMIFAHGVLSSELNDYFRTGFRPTSELRHFKDKEMSNLPWHTSCVMIRPTQSFEIAFDDSYECLRPKANDIQALGRFFCSVFDNGKSLETYIEAYTNYFNNCNEETLNASTVLIDKKSKEIIGACLISIWNDWPLIYDVGVHRDYKGKGLASKMIKKSLNHLNAHYPVLRLFVELGNHAQSLYHHLGFIAGEETTSLYMDKRRFY